MEHASTLSTTERRNFELDSLLHPAMAFADPQEVVRDCDLTVNEKRAILAFWASDACAVDSVPARRRLPGSGKIAGVHEILEALRTLDRQANHPSVDWARRQVRRGAIEQLREQLNRMGS